MKNMNKRDLGKNCIIVGVLIGITLGALGCDSCNRGMFDE